MSTYKVKRGDTLWGIAQSECGDPNQWPKIYHDNIAVIGDNPDEIYPGQVLQINCPPAACIWYKVKPGDTLSDIAKRFCGDANKWQKICDDNRDVIGDDCDLIFPGQLLCIKC